MQGPRAELAQAIPRRPRVTWWLALALGIAFAALVTPVITAERLFVALGAGHVHAGFEAKMTVRVPPFAGYETRIGHIGGASSSEHDGTRTGGVVIARGQLATAEDEAEVVAINETVPKGGVPYLAYLALAIVLAALFTHHLQRSNYGCLLRV